MTDTPGPTPHYRVDPTHSGEVGREVWVLGPPGTGKTTFLTGSVKSTAMTRGSDAVTVCSFTVAAASELQGRGLPLPKSQVGTLHSLAYRSLDRPPVVEEQLIDWNKAHPALALTIKPGSRTNLDDGAPPEAWAGATEGDALMGQLDILRAKRVDRDKWPTSTRQFWDKWQAWKKSAGLVDFTDMIEIALEDVETAPGNPDVLFCDEVQDFTPLEMALVRKWGQHSERLVLAGDDDQAIYAFKGATPTAWLSRAIDDSDKYVLSQSWRIPASVHRAAEHWIKQVGLREPKLYSPREEEGLVRHMPVSYLDPGTLVRAIDEALNQEFDGKPATVMVLGSCGYMLDPLKHELRRAGLPFHNPYRRSRSDWNPLKPSKGVSSRERLLAYLVLDEEAFGADSRIWTGTDVQKWMSVIKTQGLLARGAKGLIGALPPGELEWETFASMFVEDAELEAATKPDVDWFRRHLLAGARSGMEFPIQIAKQRGPKALLEEPRLTIGTIHSVKGGQADIVIVLPDLSVRGNAEWLKQGETRDGIVRQFYVALTRCRHELIVGAPSGVHYVSPERLLAGARPGAA